MLAERSVDWKAVRMVPQSAGRTAFEAVDWTAALMADYWELGKERRTVATRVIDWASKMVSLKAELMELRTAVQ